MISNFPKTLLPLFLIFICFFLMFISGLFGFDKESEGYFILILMFLVFYILIPSQILFIFIKIILVISNKKK